MAKDLLDLHGKTKEEVFDLVDRFLVRAQESDLKKVRIMTGKGRGIVQAETLRYLKLGGFHWNHEKNAKGQVNEGVLIIFL
ncbi:MAG: Smr/MutS family protein [Bdellovibrionales bacterium]